VSEERAEQIINDYFDQLERALLPMSRHRRDQLLDELRSHVESARAGSPGDSDAAVREALERLGDPEEIAAEALGAPHARRKGWTVFIPRWSVVAAGTAAAVVLAVVLALVLPGSTPPTSSSSPTMSAPVVAVGGFPTGIAVDPSNQTVYVAAGNSNSLSMFAESSCKPIGGAQCADPKSIGTGGEDPIGVVADPALGTLYVVNGGSNTLAVIGTAECDASEQSGCSAAPRQVPVPGGPEFLALDAATQTVYLADTTSGTVSVFDAQTCNARTSTGCDHPLATVPVGAGAFPIAVDQDTNTVYVGTNQGVAVVDGSTCRGSDIIGCSKDPATIPLSIMPAGIAVDDANRTLYVSGESGSVAVVNMSACKGSKTTGCGRASTMVSVGSDARGAALDSATSTLYVANAGSDTVSMVDTSRCNASTLAGCGDAPKSVPVGSSPRRIAIGQSSGTAFVVNVMGNNVSLLSTIACNAVTVSGCPTAHPTDSSGAQGGLEPSASVGSASSSAQGPGTSSESTCTPAPASATSGATSSTVPPSWPVAASGSIEGMSWSLRTDSGQSGANAIENGVLVLDGHTYGLCPGFPNPAELQLIDAGSNGIVAGVVGYPGKASVQLNESTAGTFATGAALPAPAVQVVQGVSFFIGTLPKSACDYPSIELNAAAAGVSAQHNLGFGTCVANQIVTITASQGEWGLPTSQSPAGPATANSTVTAPTQSAPSLPLAGKQPADPASAKADVEHAFKAVYGQESAAQKLRLVQGANQTVSAAANAAASAHAQISASSVPVVLQVVFTGPADAAVLYEIDYHGSPVVGPKIGHAVLDGGMWKVTRATFCADIDNAGTGVTC